MLPQEEKFSGSCFQVMGTWNTRWGVSAASVVLQTLKFSIVRSIYMVGAQGEAEVVASWPGHLPVETPRQTQNLAWSLI